MPTVEMPAIRAVGVSDISDIQNIARVTWAETYARLIPENVQDELLASWYSTADLERAIRSDSTIFLLAKTEQRAVGFAQFVQLSPARATLSRIYVLPEYQNRKVGTRLLDAAVAKLKSLALQTLSVEVERDNQIGRRFYARKAFREVGERTAELAGLQLPLIQCELAIQEYRLRAV